MEADPGKKKRRKYKKKENKFYNQNVLKEI